MDKGQIKADMAAAQTHKRHYLLRTKEAIFTVQPTVSLRPHTSRPGLQRTHARLFSSSSPVGVTGGEFPFPCFCLLRCSRAHLWPVLSPGFSAYQLHIHPRRDPPLGRGGAQTTGIITIKSSCGENLRLRFHYTRACFWSFITNLTLLQYWFLSLQFCYFLSVRPFCQAQFTGCSKCGSDSLWWFIYMSVTCKSDMASSHCPDRHTGGLGGGSALPILTHSGHR